MGRKHVFSRVVAVDRAVFVLAFVLCWKYATVKEVEVRVVGRAARSFLVLQIHVRVQRIPGLTCTLKKDHVESTKDERDQLLSYHSKGMMMCSRSPTVVQVS